MEKWKIRKNIFDYSLMIISSLILIIGVYFFKFSHHFSFGEVTGLAVVLSAVTPLSASSLNFMKYVILTVMKRS